VGAAAPRARVPVVQALAPLEPGPEEQPSGDLAMDGPDGVDEVEVVTSELPASPIGVMTVPPWRAGISASVLPRAYQDVLEVLVDAGGGMRAGKIVAALGSPVGAAKVEGMRSRWSTSSLKAWAACCDPSRDDREQLGADLTLPRLRVAIPPGMIGNSSSPSAQPTGPQWLRSLQG
jgi:hypothetical protein